MSSGERPGVDDYGERVVDPLMEAMRTLSEQVRLKLAEEVSTLTARIDDNSREVNRKLDYLITRVDGNNINTKGEKSFVAGTSFFTTNSNQDSLNQEDPKRFEAAEVPRSSRTGLKPDASSDLLSTEERLNGDYAYDDKLKQKDQRDKRSDYSFEEDDNDDDDEEEDSRIYNTTNSGVKRNARLQDSNQDENEMQTLERRTKPKTIPKGRQNGDNAIPEFDKDTFEQGLHEHGKDSRELVNESGEAEFRDDEEVSDAFEKLDHVKSQPYKHLVLGREYVDEKEEAVQSTGYPLSTSRNDSGPNTRRGIVKDYNTNGWKKQDADEFKSYQADGEIPRTEDGFVEDTTQSESDYNEEERSAQRRYVKKQKSVENNFDQDSDTDVKKVKAKEGITNRAKNVNFKKEQDQDRVSRNNGTNDRGTGDREKPEDRERVINPASNMSNNKLPKSGFKNEHGNDDNRFIAASHEEVSHASINRSRSTRLSNLQLVKNGPRRPTSEDRRASDSVGARKKVAEGATGGSNIPNNRPKDVGNGGNLVQDSVLHALIEKERLSVSECQDAKSPGIDTVICLDTSASMSGQPIKTALAAVSRLIDGFENNAIYNDLEENVAIVTFGKENKILRHLTNDYNVLRDSLDTITTTGGPSPLWLGVALSLTEIKERGGACTMNPMSVMPRIILVTDGFASRKNLLNGEDDNNVDAEVLRELLSLLDTCRAFTSYMECIIVGPCHEDVLNTFTDGRMFTAEDLDHVTQFFRIQEEANRICKDAMDGKISRDDIDDEVKRSVIGGNAKEELLRVVTAVLKNVDLPKVEELAPKATNEANDTNHSKMSEGDKADQPEETPEKEKTEEQPHEEPETKRTPTKAPKQNEVRGSSLPLPEDIDDVEAPPFGAAMEAVPDWVGFHSRRSLKGTVISTRKKGMVKIMWSDGTSERCKYGVGGQYDVRLCDDQTIDTSAIHVGSLVKRGKDWRWKDQDGGVGNIGVVMKIENSVIHVTWPHGGQGNYRYGYNLKYDVELCARPVSGNAVAWFILDEDGKWTRLPEEVSDSIEQMNKVNQSGTFLVKTGDKSLRISIQNLQARDINTQNHHAIKRKELIKGEWMETQNDQ